MLCDSYLLYHASASSSRLTSWLLPRFTLPAQTLLPGLFEAEHNITRLAGPVCWMTVVMKSSSPVSAYKQAFGVETHLCRCAKAAEENGMTRQHEETSLATNNYVSQCICTDVHNNVQRGGMGGVDGLQRQRNQVAGHNTNDHKRFSGNEHH